MTSMIATAQGPMPPPITTAGKLFASLLAFVSIGVVVAAVGFLFGPFLGQLWKVGLNAVLLPGAEVGKGASVYLGP